jgi:hypothetical protein
VEKGTGKRPKSPVAIRGVDSNCGKGVGADPCGCDGGCTVDCATTEKRLPDVLSLPDADWADSNGFEVLIEVAVTFLPCDRVVRVAVAAAVAVDATDKDDDREEEGCWVKN